MLAYKNIASVTVKPSFKKLMRERNPRTNGQVQTSQIQINRSIANMILSCYIFDLRRHLQALKFIPGCAPYELQENSDFIVVSRSKFRRRMFVASQLFSLATFVAMCFFLFAKSYDIFLTLFGMLVLVAYFTTLLVRWNPSCSSKYIDVFNQFLVFESKMKLKPSMNTKNQTGMMHLAE